MTLLIRVRCASLGNPQDMGGPLGRAEDMLCNPDRERSLGLSYKFPALLVMNRGQRPQLVKGALGDQRTLYEAGERE